MNKKIKILHLLQSNSFSGAENVVITIISKIQKINSNFEFYYCSPNGSIEKYCRENNVNFIGIDKLSLKALEKVVHEYTPDIIHAHDFTAIFISSLLTNKYKVIGHLHNNPKWLVSYNIKSLIFLISTLRIDKFLLVSKAIKDEFKFRNSIKRYEIIGNPIDYDKIIKYQIKEKKRQLLFIGRLENQKNPLRFLRIIKKLQEKGIDFKTLVIGDGTLRDDCEKYIYDCKLKNISTLGFIKDPYQYISESMVTLMTSEWEGYGLVGVESLILGTPVVATRVGGIPSYLNNAIGYIYDEDEDAIDEIIKLLDDNVYYASKQQRALEFARTNFSDNSYYFELIRVYKEVLNQR